MINKIKSILGQKCQFCGKLNDEQSFKAEVKIPGLLNQKEKWFCSADCLKYWEDYVKEHSKHNKCSGCCCGR